jgi:hypothetical protein
MASKKYEGPNKIQNAGEKKHFHAYIKGNYID